MCGMIGALGIDSINDDLITGLDRLKHPEFDDCNIIIANHDTVSSNSNLSDIYLNGAKNPGQVNGKIGIGTALWKLENGPNSMAGRPYVNSKNIVLSWSGLITNSEFIRRQLIKIGYQAHTESDIELVGLLFDHHFELTNDIHTAVRKTFNQIQGNHAMICMNGFDPERLIAMCKGGLLAAGSGSGKRLVSSNPGALKELVDKWVYLEDGDIADIRIDKIDLYDSKDKKIHRKTGSPDSSLALPLRQTLPESTLLSLLGRLSYKSINVDVLGKQATTILKNIHHVQMVSSVENYQTGLVGKLWIEKLSGIPCQLELASNYRTRQKTIDKNKLFISLSQNGEDPDTLAALRIAKNMKYEGTLAICSMPLSSIVSNSDMTLLTASILGQTSSINNIFMDQLLGLFILAMILGKFHRLDSLLEYNLVKSLRKMPKIFQKSLHKEQKFRKVAKQIEECGSVTFICDDLQEPIVKAWSQTASEKFLIQCETYLYYAHNPVFDSHQLSNTLILIMVPDRHFMDRILQHDIIVKGQGKMVIFGHMESMEHHPSINMIHVPYTNKLFHPFMAAMITQSLAYYMKKTTDGLQP